MKLRGPGFTLKNSSKNKVEAGRPLEQDWENIASCCLGVMGM